MGREVKRVPVGFGWPMNKVWGGYLSPDSLDGIECESCGGSGDSPEARQLKARWYGYVPFQPSETGSTVLTVETPEVRAFAERNVTRAPEFYGGGEYAIVAEARRLADLWNGMWMHHLAQGDVDLLVAADRLRDFTHTWTQADRWQPREPAPTVTAAEVNRWSLHGMGHDSTALYVLQEARAAAEGWSSTCSICDGHGSTEAYPGQRADAEAWERTDPPEGEGWQLWETVSEGSPISPVFGTAGGLSEWMQSPAYTWGASTPLTKEQADAFVALGWAPSLVGSSAGIVPGEQFIFEAGEPR